MKEPEFIWQQPGWPALRYDSVRVGAEVALARRTQGIVEGKLAALGFEQRQQLAAEAWTQEAMATAAIEGERLDLQAVRSSVARRLGVADLSGAHAPRHIDGLLDIMDDAVSQACAPLTHERLQAWQAALFPTGFSGMRPILVGAYRQHAEPMQIVSGRPGHETVHYEAPPSAAVPPDMAQLLRWASWVLTLPVVLFSCGPFFTSALRDLQQRKGTAILLITHDMGVIAEMTDRVAVFHEGRLVTTLTTRDTSQEEVMHYASGRSIPSNS